MAKSPSPLDLPWVNVGARIRHSTFGEGVVAWKGMVKGGAAVKVEFDLIGEKWLDPETADQFVTMTRPPADPEGRSRIEHRHSHSATEGIG